MVDLNNYYLIGEIVRPHSLLGGVKVKPYAEFPDIKGIKKLLIHFPHSKENSEKKVVKLQQYQNHFLFFFEDVNHRDEAEKLRNGRLYVHEDEMKKLDKGNGYYFRDLERCTVFDEDNVCMGKVTSIMETGAHEILEIKDEKGNENLIPFIDEFLINVDIAAKKIIVKNLEILE
ncbi:MAG: 16S rRNA processing protein RimM [Nitrospinae bacterium]|nr:16S rRNA processing protein RimM [Nitrospinota bacterium]